ASRTTQATMPSSAMARRTASARNGFTTIVKYFIWVTHAYPGNAAVGIANRLSRTVSRLSRASVYLSVCRCHAGHLAVLSRNWYLIKGKLTTDLVFHLRTFPCLNHTISR